MQRRTSQPGCREWLCSLRNSFSSGFVQSFPLLVCLLFLLGVSGCELFSIKEHALKRVAKKLPPLQSSPNSIVLKYTFLERPAGDSKLSGLWTEVDEILSQEDPDYQKNLIKNGFRIGVLSSLPSGLLELMAPQTEDQKTQVSETISNGEPHFAGHSLFITPGRPFPIKAGDQFPQCDLTLFHNDPQKPRETKSFTQVNGVFQVTAQKEQEGWASLEFTPEFHHGDETLRPQAGETEWQSNFAQLCEKLYDQRFRLHLNVGDTAIVTSQDNCPGTAGHYFFRGAGVNSSVQRILLVRLVHVPGRTESTPPRGTLKLTSELEFTPGRSTRRREHQPARLNSGRVSFR